MVIDTSRFGQIDVCDDSIIRMTDGMLGFSGVKDYVLVQHRDGSPFLWYQAVAEPNLAFLVMDPFTFFPDYEVMLSQEDLTALGCAELGDLAVFAVVVIPDNPEEMTANLRGPIVVNAGKRIARQVVLTDERYSPRHSIMREVRNLCSARAAQAQQEQGATDASSQA
jgi:flagellar assembly factor FliW